MKKTIIALIALAGAAAGADFSQLTMYPITLGDVTTTSISTGSAKIWVDGQGSGKNLNYGWMMEFSISAHALTADAGHIIFRAQGRDGGLEITLKGDNTILLTDGSGKTSITDSLTLTTDTVYRAAFDPNAESVYLTNTSTGDWVKGYWSKNVAGWANIGTYASTFYTGDAVTINVGNAYDMEGISGSTFEEYATDYSPAVPEPTTATLSLLALAGLAARRSRK